MTHSMTAFARKEVQANWGSAIWELRSVNHRYLEISLRLPEPLSILEHIVREKIKSQLQRGKVDINLRYKQNLQNTNQITVNKDLVQQLVKAHTEIASLIKETTAFTAADVLRWPGVLAMPEENLQPVQKELLSEFEQALADFISAREREGEALKKLLQQRLTAMQIEIDKIKKLLPNILNLQREKLINRFKEANLTLEPARFEQEMVLFAQKIDITEELDRLETHIAEIKRILKQTDSNGRRLDFLLQELNREANTLASKSVTSETTLAAVALKVLIEQMREQAQNIE